MAASAARRAWTWRRRSRRASCRPWSAPRRWSWASTSAPWTWWSSSSRPTAWPGACSGWAAPATWWARPAPAAFSPPTARTCWRRRPSSRPCCAGRRRADLRAAEQPGRAGPADRGHGQRAGLGRAGAVRLVRRAYPYHRLTPELYRSVLDMLSGRYPSTAFRELRPRIAWDRVHNRLTALPGSRLLAIRNGGTIPDRGAFAAYLPDRKTRLGELDEEFVFETRPGDVFTLGASTWRVQEVTDDRLIVTPAPGHLPRMPFWRGDAPRRDYHLGVHLWPLPPRTGRAHRVDAEMRRRRSGCRNEYRARHPLGAQRRELCPAPDGGRWAPSLRTGPSSPSCSPTPSGDLRLVIHSCFGARVNSPWALALAQAFREALGTRARGHGQRRRHPLPFSGDRPRAAPRPDPRDGAGRRPASACWPSCPTRRSLAPSSG